MIHPSIFKKHKCDTDSLKALATAEKPSKKWQKLKAIICDRIRDGRERSLKDYRVWAAVDLAYDAPFHQETPTIIRHILSEGGDAKAIQTAMKSWGLCEGKLFCRRKGEDGKETLWLNPQIFHEILIPVTRAYVSVRLAKIFNDRNLTPLFKYEPQRMTQVNRARCEIITDLVQRMATQFGYAENLKQMILNALLYSECMEFPVEAWFAEKQETESGDTYTVREGIRHVSPHITRTFRDLQHPAYTLNTDTGCTFAGYWSIMRAGDVVENPIYWNTESIGYDRTNWLDKEGTYRNYFDQAYPCTLELPVYVDAKKETSREKIANLYTAADHDKALFVTHIFMKFKPADFGIGTYKHPVWFRFIVGSADTIIFAEPLAYRPVTFCGYDTDQNRAKNVSLALEILPFQDMLGNLLTQIVLTIKRNLSNIQFYDTNIIDKEQAELLQTRSQWQYQNLNMIGFDSIKSARKGANPDKALHEVKFAYANTNEMTQTIGTVISILERLLVISPQEIGASASHQQSKAEVIVTNSNSTNRVTFTATYVDEAIDAKKQQLYDAAMAYMDDEVVSQVSADVENLKEVLSELGFNFDEKKDKAGEKFVVRGKKSKLVSLERFASTKDGPDRGNDMQTAQALSLAVQSVSQNQILGPAIDPESLLKVLTQAAVLAGAPDDFKLKLRKDGGAAQQIGQMMEQIQKLIQDTVAANMKPAAEAVAEQEGKIQETQQAVVQTQQGLAQITQLVEQLQRVITAATAAPPLPPTGQPPLPDGTAIQQPLVQ